MTQPSWMAPYLQILDRNAFGNFRQLLYEISVSPAMGRYLDIAGNTRANPNENYAREMLQLFSIGTVQLNLGWHAATGWIGQPIPPVHAGRREQLRTRVYWMEFGARRPQPASQLHRSDGCRTKRSTIVERKDLLNGVVPPAGQTATKDLNDAHRQHLQSPECRAVHLEAADSASRDEQPEPGICRADGRRSSTTTAPVSEAI